MRNLYNLIMAVALALPLCTSMALAQNREVGSNLNATRTQLAPIARLGVVNMREKTENWDPFLKTVQKIHEPGIDPRKDRVAELKAEADKVHEALIAAGVPSSSSQKTSAFTAPTLGTNFIGNAYDATDPADNAIAISEAGLMISGSNRRFSTYDANGNQTSSKNFGAFASAGGQSTGFTFDPKCNYDPVADRFVIAFLSGSTPASSKIILAFSQTNDPAGAWNVYSISGNVNNLGVWTDFVQLGLNTNEVFVAGNPFDQTSSPVGAAIWQINKADGYSGAAISPVVHYTPDGFSLHPVQGGATLYGPNMFFLESDLVPSDNIKLHQITNSIANSGVLNPGITFTLNASYSLSPGADQRGTSINLKTNDTRIQNSYFENSRIEFVLNSNVNGMAGVLHGTGIISPFLLAFSSFSAQLLGYSDLDIAYPAIAYAGQQDLSGFNHSYISFNTSGPNNFPGIAAVYADENGYSPKVVIKEGVSFITAVDDRWGDYAGLEERKNHPGEVWAAGTMGDSLHQQRTYIGQLLPPLPAAIAPVVDNRVKMELFPNPATEIVKFEFPVMEAGEYKVLVSDLQGRVVKIVVQNWLAKGQALLSFNAQYLASGTYIVSVENDSQKLFAEKLVVTH